MTLIPPIYVNAPVREVYSLSLSDAHFRTLVQIRGLAYQYKDERTPPITHNDLMALRGLNRSQIYEHLKYLREKGYIRVEYIGTGLFVVYPLRWEPGAALPTDERDDLADEEKMALLGEKPSPENRTQSPENRTHHDHVVVLNHDSEQERQQHDLSPENRTQTEVPALLADLAAVLEAYGMDGPAAEALAAELAGEMDGRAEVCRRQLGVFDRRCELARASKRGLQNPIGLLCASIREDWPLPAADGGNGKTRHRWFTEEEEREFFYHGPLEAEEVP